MNISEAAKLSGVTAKTIRFYEQKGVITAATRSANGYRTYTENQTSAIRFIKQARDLGFSLEECKQLLDLKQSPTRSSADVKTRVLEHITRIEAQIESLEEMKTTLLKISASCPGDDGHDCPILDSLSNNN